MRAPSLALLTIAALSALPAAAQLAEPPESAGRYEFTADLGGRAVDGVIELMHATGTGEWSGELRLGSLPPARVTGAHSSGSALHLQLRLPEGSAAALLRLRPDGSFAGEIDAGRNVIAISGRKTRTGPLPPLHAFLPHVQAAIDGLAPRALADAGEAGLAVAAVEGGTRWVQGYGLRDRDHAVGVGGATIFQVGSISKLLTAWGVMRLVEMGMIGLDAPVNRYLTRWTVPSGEFDASAVTVRRLLSHTAGINVPSISGVDPSEAVPDIVSELRGAGPGADSQVRVVRQPGNGFAYSGGGYMILQLLIEDVTGRSFAEYMRTEVLLPLGMVNSFFGWNDTVAAHVATPHSDVAERDRRHRLFAGLAGAGLYTTADDLAELLAAHFPGDAGRPAGRGVVSSEALAGMMLPDAVARSYGLGYEIHPLGDGAYAAGHGGSNIGWKANLIVVPDLRIGFAVLSNADRGTARAAVLEVAREALARMRRTIH